MSYSIKQRTASIADKSDAQDLKKLYDAILLDLTELRSKMVTLNAKLDADAGVTDTNYGTLCNPAALKLQS